MVATAAKLASHSVGGGVPEKLLPFSGLALGSCGPSVFSPFRAAAAIGYRKGLQ